MGALTLSNAMTSKERDCGIRNFCLKFLLAYFYPVQLGFSGLYILPACWETRDLVSVRY